MEKTMKVGLAIRQAVSLGLLYAILDGPGVARAQDKPATHPATQAAAAPEVLPVSELEQSQTDGIIKDFQILQLKFANRIAEIKKAHNWGDDVLYDANQNKFYRLPKPETKTEPKSKK